MLLRPLSGKPNIELIVKSGAFLDLLARLEDHTLDLVLANQPAMLDQDTEWHNSLIAEQSVSLIGAAGLVKRPFQFPADLVNMPVAVPARGNSIRAAFDNSIQAAGIEPTVAAEVDDMPMLRLIARDGSCLVLAPPVVVTDELQAGTLASIAGCPR